MKEKYKLRVGTLTDRKLNGFGDKGLRLIVDGVGVIEVTNDAAREFIKTHGKVLRYQEVGEDRVYIHVFRGVKYAQKI